MSEYLEYQSKNVPDSLFRVSVQRSASDSAQTPPSPVVYSKPRLSRADTHSSHPSKSHRSNRRSDSHRSSSSSTAPTPQFRREKERQLANVPRDTLLQLTITKEYELREAKHLLTTALIQLEANREKFVHERDIRFALEDEKKDQAVKTTKTLIDTQQDAMDAREEVRRFQLQLENSQSELHKVADVVHQLESDRTDLERELVRARDTARTFKEQNVILHAREEGRREGFEEGLRQGRAMHGIVDLTQPPHLPLVQDSNVKESPQEKRRKSPVKERHSHSIETEIDLRKIAEKDNYRLNLQVTQLSRELDQQRQKTKEVETDRKRLVDEVGRLKRELRAKNEEIAKLTGKGASFTKELQALERKGKESVAKRDKQIHELKAEVEQLLADNETMQKEKEVVEQKMKQELEKEKEQRVKEKEAAAAAAAAAASKSSAEPRIAYLPMPPPPIPPNIPTSGPVPRASSSGSGSGLPKGKRRFSVGSQSSAGSAPFETHFSPGTLSVIHERDHAAGNPSPQLSFPPSWNPSFPQPTIPQIILPPRSESPRGVPPNSHFLHPIGNPLYGLPNGRLANGSQSSININIEPPSRPPSSVDHQEFDPSGAFLAPNHQPTPVATQDTPLPVLPRMGRNPTYERETSTQPNSPVIPGVTVPMPSRGVPSNTLDGPFPPGFVPQTITNSNGVSTPIWQSAVLPSSAGPSIGGLPPQPHSAPAAMSGPIYGNPLNQNREEEDEPYVPFSSFGPAVRPGGGPAMPTTRPNGTGPGTTPVTSPRNLPGSGANVGPRSGVSIYAPAPPPMALPNLANNNNSWGYSPGPGIPGPLPHSAPSPEDDENDDIDSETALNTRINAGIGMRDVAAVVGQPEFGRGPPSGRVSSGFNNFRR